LHGPVHAGERHPRALSGPLRLVDGRARRDVDSDQSYAGGARANVHRPRVSWRARLDARDAAFFPHGARAGVPRGRLYACTDRRRVVSSVRHPLARAVVGADGRLRVTMTKVRRSREGGNLVAYVKKTLGPRL